jgi:hypothetical protein
MMTFFKRLEGIPWLAEAAAMLFGLVYAGWGLFFAHTSDSLLDEGAYLYKGLLFVTGRYWPYQDYGPWTNHMPLSFLIPGTAQTLFGAGLRTGRYFMVVVGVLMLAGVWLLGKRFGGRWWALFAVAALALNPALIQFYSIGVTQGLVACMLVWTMVLTLGEGRALWQLLLGSILAGVTLTTRENMVPVLALLVLYIFWQHGVKAGIWAAVAGLLTVGIIHAIYWPKIMGVWANWLPGDLTPFLDPMRRLGGGKAIWNPNMSLESRALSFIEGLRANFIPLVAVFGFGLVSFLKKEWKSSSFWRAALFLTVLFGTLFLAHAWASLWKSYCTFCFSGYLAFFSPVGLILIILTNRGVKEDGIRWYGWIAVPLIILVSTAVGAGAFQVVGRALLQLPVPRIKGGELQQGFVPIQAILENMFRLNITAAMRLLSTLAGLAFGVGFVLVVWFLYRRWSSRGSLSMSYGIFALDIFLLTGLLLAPTPILAVNAEITGCRGDVIAAYEQAGAHLRDLIPAGSKVYWDGGLSVVPMLYLPGVDIYPPLINDGYAFRKGGDADGLYRSGFWNDELSKRWKDEADFIIVEEWRYIDDWKQFVESGEFQELERTNDLSYCTEKTGLRIFRRER